MNSNYIRVQAKRYISKRYDNDECLYKIGCAAGVLTQADLQQMHGGKLTPALRSRVLQWLRENANQIGLTVQD